jgi:hypothetical protein
LWRCLCYQSHSLRPESLINNDVLGDVSKGTEDTRTHELSTLDAVLLHHIVSVPDGGSEVILMTAREEEVLSGLNLRSLIEAKANLCCTLSVFLLLLLGKVDGLHLFDKVVRLLSLFCYHEGSGDNVFEGVTLPVAYTLVSGHVTCNDKTVGADETEDTCHDTEGGRAIVRVYDNNLRTSFVRGESIEEVTVGETNAVLVVNSGTLASLDGLSEGVSDFVTFGAESVNHCGSGELTILLSTARGVRGFKNLGATSGDFLISECEHSLDYPF